MNLRIYAGVAVVLLSACAHVDNGRTYGATEGGNTAQLIAEKGSTWGAFIQKVATTAIREVNGESFQGHRHPIKIDDMLFLGPGRHAIGIRVWGSPKGYPPAGTESFACLHLNVKAQRIYILRGRIDGEHFRVEVIERVADSEKLISSLPIPAETRRGERICP